MRIAAAFRLRCASNADVASALLAISKWINVTQSSPSANKLPTAIRTLIEVVPYEPHLGDVFRAFTLKQSVQKVRVGDKVKLATGLRSRQSWAGSEKAARAFRGYLGNTERVVIVKLLSPGLQLFNTVWFRKVLAKLKSSTDPAVVRALKEANSVISRRGSVDDEDEVIMELPAKSLVQVIGVTDAYRH